MKERKIIGSTTKCIVCLQDAEYRSAHVRKGDDDVIAGWCEKHHSSYIMDYKTHEICYLLDTVGCFGEWNEQYGFKAE